MFIASEHLILPYQQIHSFRSTMPLCSHHLSPLAPKDRSMPMTVLYADIGSTAGRHRIMTVRFRKDMTIRLTTAVTVPISQPWGQNTLAFDTITTSNQFGAILVWQTLPDSDHSFLHWIVTAKKTIMTPARVVTVSLQTPAGTYELLATQTSTGSTLAFRNSLDEFIIGSTTLFTQHSSDQFTFMSAFAKITQLQSFITQHSFSMATSVNHIHYSTLILRSGLGKTIHSFTDGIHSFDILDIRLIAAWHESPGVFIFGQHYIRYLCTHLSHSF